MVDSTKRSRGFALPSVIITSVVMMIVLLAGLSATVSISASLQERYHVQLASEAAETGVAYIMNCLRSQSTPVLNRSYVPNSNSCSDPDVNTSLPGYVVGDINSLMRSRFSVTVIANGNVGYRLIAQGIVELARSSDTTKVARTIDTSISAEAPYRLFDPSSFSVVTRGYTAYATLPDGSLWAWGRNASGQVGNNSTVDVATPTKIMDGPVKQVVASEANDVAYAVLEDGSLWAWGENQYGQVGNNSTSDRLTPVQVIASGVGSVHVGAGTAFALMENGSLRGWGRNNTGQVGNNTLVNQLTPVQIISNAAPSVREVVPNQTSTMTHVIKTDGSLWGWGNNGAHGQVGNASTANQLTPVQIIAGGTPSVKQVVVSGASTALLSSPSALMTDGTVRRWGSGFTTAPVAIASFSGVDRLYAGTHATFAITTSGALYSWGYNSNGSIGNGTSGAVTVSVPYQVFGSGVESVTATRIQPAIFAHRTNGSVYGWGKNNYCQLADGTTTDQFTPIQVMPSGDGIKKVHSYFDGNLAGGALYPRVGVIKSDDSLWMWGSQINGQLGDGVSGTSTSMRCTPVKVLEGVAKLAEADYYTTFAITRDFRLWSWGNNAYTQIGRSTPPLNNLPGVVTLPKTPPKAY